MTGDEVPAAGRVSGDGPLRGAVSLGDCGPVTERAAETAVETVGRGTAGGLVVLLLLLPGLRLEELVVGDEPWALRVLGTFSGSGSSVEIEPCRVWVTRERSAVLAELLAGKGEKLPGALGWGLEDCMDGQ